VESALRDELQFVVVPTFEDALQAIEFLKAEGAGRATFLVINQNNGQPGELENSLQHGPSDHTNHFSTGNGNDGNNGGNGHHNGHASGQPGYQTLGSLLGLRPEFSEAFKFALPSLANARIVNDADEAVHASISQNGNAHAAMMLAR